MQRNGTSLMLARWSARHPWRAIAGWLVFVVACVALGAAVGTRQLTDAETGSGESGRADVAIEQAQFPSKVQESVLIQAKAGNLDPSEASEVVKELRTEFRELPSVMHIGDPIPSEDGTAVLLPLVMADGGAAGFDAVSVAAAGIQPTLDATAAVQAAHPDLWVEQAGDASIESVLGNQLDSDFQKAEFLSLPITLGILLLAFGALFAAGVPVLLALSAVASAIGLSALVSQVLPVTEELASVVCLSEWPWASTTPCLT